MRNASRLHLTSLQERRVSVDMIKVFKVVNGLDVVNAGEQFLQMDFGPRRDRTRSPSLKLHKPRHRTLKRTIFFSSRVVDHWNGLPQEVVESTSISSFKNRYDQYMNRPRQ